MTNGSIRRAQLISPFGVGAMTVLVDGSSVITCGLDHWFEGEDVDVGAYRIDEWRLQRRLRVNHFRLPPDHRTPYQGMPKTPNLRLAIPFLRFPTWSFCPYCKRLEQQPLALQGKARCPDSRHQHSGKPAIKGPAMSQVPFVVICEKGHIGDFPWREWVHRSIQPTCRGTLRLHAVGTGSLSGQLIRCEGCDKSRSLEGVTTATSVDGEPTTVLTSRLEKGADYSCRGWRPWLGEATQPCGQPLRGSLRGASNVYFPLVESSIYLPQSASSTPPKLLEILNRPDFVTALQFARKTGEVTSKTIRIIDEYDILTPFTDADIQAALDEVSGGEKAEHVYDFDELSPTEWRRPEYDMLRHGIDHPNLVVTTATSPYGDAITEAFSRVRLVESLRETRALWGFTRLTSSGHKLKDGKSQLWKEQPSPARDWLPAYTVSGEGIYLELDEQQLQSWERREEVQRRAQLIARRYMSVVRDRLLAPREVTPRFILIHTVAHLLINQLIFECGYSTASLRERLYVADERGSTMAGLLIYTAAGDAEGTMGGLVRMGKPGHLERAWSAALASAEWCSTDPLCMEAGEGGQGPDSCNLAACHSCALLPETACEEFNRFLDRGLVIGSLKEPELGFFNS
ncbi:DrmB family protein [Nonomuraea sp. NPDC049400]|uniref:DrmB family protein n=1 Tax=Nonomuraea sp. NPDC049400 TaxID=3364352 RepID=UPI0037B57E20